MVSTGSTGGDRGRFDVWAPERDRVRLVVQPVPEGSSLPEEASVPEEGRSPVSKGTKGATLDMTLGDDGWWTPAGEVPEGEVDYGYLLDDATDPRPDPRSRRQPSGVHALSRTWDPASHAWQDAAWTGRQLAGSVVYELHVGTFSRDGTLDGAIEKLPHLVDLGVDLVELLPVNAFDGDRGWGYDGVQWYAVHETYGGPAAYARFVDACHAHGLGVVQDVVYNHLGPSGNYLPEFGPYLHATGQNSWGSSLNLDGERSEHVRRYIVDNALMWLRDLHVDALRLDAVHALADTSITHLLEQLGSEVDALSAHVRRPLTLIAESDLNDTRMVTPREAGGRGIHAQWSDDFHHAVHVALTGETSGYYGDFAPLSALVKVCERGFLHDGTYSTFRGRPHGRPVDTAAMPTWRLVVCNQNHDQVGNRATGDRLAATLDDDQLVCAALLTLAGPFTPMLWQGEEWAASTPFQFFTGFTDEDLAEAVRTGRRSEFASHGWGEQDVPDPQDPATYDRSRLDWDEPATGRHAVVLDAYRRLGALRRSVPDLTDPSFGSVVAWCDEASRVFTLHRGSTLLAINFGDATTHVSDDIRTDATLAFTTPTAASLDGGVLTLPPHSGALVVDET